jgi:type II secretory pathway pseudopilin PulG
MFYFSSRNGQSLIEVLVGTALAAIFIVGAAVLIAPALNINKSTTQIQNQTELAGELMGNVRAWANGNWNTMLSIATGTTNSYYLNTSSSPFSAASGTESVAVSGVVFTRYFYVTDVYRDTNGNVTSTVSANFYDPSTKQVNVAIGLASSTSPSIYVFYVTRNVNNAFGQSSWSGTSGQTNPVSIIDNNYAASSNVTIDMYGDIKLSAGGSGCVL